MNEKDEELDVTGVASSTQLDELYRSIGIYIFEFSRLDDTLKCAASSLLGLSDEQYDGIMPAIDFVTACNLCKAQIIALLPDDKATAEALDLLNKCLKTNEDRNRVAHGFWFSASRSFASIHSSRTSFKQGLYFREPGELTRKATEIRSLRESIWRDIVERADRLQSDNRA